MTTPARPLHRLLPRLEAQLDDHLGARLAAGNGDRWVLLTTIALLPLALFI